MNNWAVYCLCEVNDGKQTYIGATINVDRRLRQHNGVLSGGAKRTAGHEWKRMCHVVGFTSSNDALRFEWRWKFISRKFKGTSLERRFHALYEILNEDKGRTEILNLLSESEDCYNYFNNKEMSYAILV